MIDLFRINRSLTGEGNRTTLNYFKKINPELKFLKFKSGKKIFDWTIPKEWIIRSAYLKHLRTQKVFANFKNNNLHLVGYSIPIKKIIDFKELKKKIFTLKNYPKAIPYVTSYYKKDWGFCMSYNEIKKMPKGKYQVIIDANFKNNYLDLCHAVLRGKSKKEIMFTSYICHPSMANNELSGPVLLNEILKYVKENFKNRNYTYRFLLCPETIGSIAYLSKFRSNLKKNLIAGYVLSCVGDGRAYSQILSPDENNLADKSLSASLIGKKNVKIHSFLNRGSDERQFSSPKINLPFTTFCRSKFGTYPEYHTSKDDLSLINQKNLSDSFQIIKNIIMTFEKSLFPISTKFCEPHLSKYNLYPTTSTLDTMSNKKLTEISDLLAFSNGKNTLFDISKKTGHQLKNLLDHSEILKKNRLIRIKKFQ